MPTVIAKIKRWGYMEGERERETETETERERQREWERERVGESEMISWKKHSYSTTQLYYQSETEIDFPTLVVNESER